MPTDSENKARRDGKRVGRPSFGYDVDESGFMCQDPAEYNRAQNFIREVKLGRAKEQTEEFFEIPQSAVQSILKRAEKNYEIKFDNSQWKVEAGEGDLSHWSHPMQPR